jgi:hypothetical protein
MTWSEGDVVHADIIHYNKHLDETKTKQRGLNH